MNRALSLSLLGFLVGIISCLSYLYLTPALKRFLRLNDTAGTHSLHGLPALLGSAISLIFVAVSEDIVAATQARFVDANSDNAAVDKISERFPSLNTTVSVGFTYDIEPSDLYLESGAAHAGTHAAILGVTLILALASGCLVGAIIRCFNYFFRTAVDDDDMYSDKAAFVVPDDFQEE